MKYWRTMAQAPATTKVHNKYAIGQNASDLRATENEDPALHSSDSVAKIYHQTNGNSMQNKPSLRPGYGHFRGLLELPSLAMLGTQPAIYEHEYYHEVWRWNQLRTQSYIGSGCVSCCLPGASRSGLCSNPALTPREE